MKEICDVLDIQNGSHMLNVTVNFSITANTECMIYLVLAVIFLFAVSVPWTVRVNVDIDYDGGKGEIKVRLFFIPVVKKRFDPKRFFKSARDKNTEQSDNDGKGKSKMSNGFLRTAAVKLLDVTVVRDMRLDADIGLGDAAASAVVCGFLRVMYGHLCEFLCCDDKSEVVPNYGAEALNVRFSGIFSLCIADIIYVIFATVCARIAKSAGAKRKYAKSVAE